MLYARDWNWNLFPHTFNGLAFYEANIYKYNVMRFRFTSLQKPFIVLKLAIDFLSKKWMVKKINSSLRDQFVDFFWVNWCLAHFGAH